MKPKVQSFQIFWYLVRTKLEPTTEKGIFVGYSKISKAYKIYILSLRKIMVRRDVMLEEDRAFKRSHDSEATDQKQKAPNDEVSPIPANARDQSSDQEEAKIVSSNNEGCS